MACVATTVKSDQLDYGLIVKVHSH